jgi:2-keto-4-pentenoate hydratase/2-oxohepta-3-ene-1,7-dioic acid hydratase in catechol pathway
MRIVRYALDDDVHYGTLEGGHDIARLAGPPFDAILPTGDVDDARRVRMLAPLDRPRVFGLAYNYVSHVTETDRKEPEIPVLFMKPSTAVIGPGESIVYPSDGELVHFEGELVVVIGKQGRHVSVEDALDHVLGYTCGNDVSDRIVQRKESAFGCLLAGKGYDTFAPLGPAIVTDLDPSGLALTTRVNGAVRQSANTGDLLFSVPRTISYLSRYFTLLPGDAIMTGTPAGVGPIKPGDRIEVEIEGIGVLGNDVVPEVI